MSWPQQTAFQQDSDYNYARYGNPNGQTLSALNYNDSTDIYNNNSYNSNSSNSNNTVIKVVFGVGLGICVGFLVGLVTSVAFTPVIGVPCGIGAGVLISGWIIAVC